MVREALCHYFFLVHSTEPVPLSNYVDHPATDVKSKTNNAKRLRVAEASAAEEF